MTCITVDKRNVLQHAVSEVKYHLCYAQPVKRPVDVTQSHLLDDEANVVHNEVGDEWVFQGDNTQNDFCKQLFMKEHVNHSRL